MTSTSSRLKIVQITAQLLAMDDAAEALLILEGVAVGVIAMSSKPGHHNEVAALFHEDVLKQLKTFDDFHQRYTQGQGGPTTPNPKEPS
jgi:hypothetical protein